MDSQIRELIEKIFLGQNLQLKGTTSQRKMYFIKQKREKFRNFEPSVNMIVWPALTIT